MKSLRIILLIILAIPIIIFAPRIFKDIKKKLSYTNTYAIQNIKTGKNIRVQNANYHDNEKVVIYNPHNWECMTWELIQLESNIFLVKNLYTQKTFEPVTSVKSGVSLWQKSLGGSKLQYWEFLKQTDDTYFIRLKDTELYITIESESKDSTIILSPKQNSNNQRWKLIRQNPIV